jgi:5-formyltetrahydrofolate cyclo-ligase
MSAPLDSAKAGLRQQVRARLSALTPPQREAASLQICSRLRQQAIWQTANSVLFFSPLPDEPDIWPLLEAAHALGKTVALPRFAADTKAYTAACLLDLRSDFPIGRFGIREPAATCAEIPLNRLDLVLVPGVAFQPDGCRLGRGRGFYDRLLAAVRGTKCGVAFDEQMVEAIPVGPLDVRLNCIITPTRWMET